MAAPRMTMSSTVCIRFPVARSTTCAVRSASSVVRSTRSASEVGRREAPICARRLLIAAMHAPVVKDAPPEEGAANVERIAR